MGGIVSERDRASRTRIGDGKLNLSIYHFPSHTCPKPTSKGLQAVEHKFDEYDLSCPDMPISHQSGTRLDGFEPRYF